MKIGGNIDLDLTVGTDGKIRMRLIDLRKSAERAGPIPLTPDDARVMITKLQRAIRMASAVDDPTER